MQWYYSINEGPQEGPVTFGQLKNLANSYRLGPDDLVWNEGLPDWIEAHKIDGLIPFSSPSTSSEPTEPSYQKSSSAFDRQDRPQPRPTPSKDTSQPSPAPSPPPVPKPQATPTPTTTNRYSPPPSSDASLDHMVASLGDSSPPASFYEAKILQRADQAKTWLWLVGIAFALIGLVGVGVGLLSMLGSISFLAKAENGKFIFSLSFGVYLCLLSIFPPVTLFLLARSTGRFLSTQSNDSLASVFLSIKYLAMGWASAVVLTVLFAIAAVVGVLADGVPQQP